jgi:RHS repeat-associated protein
MQRLCTGEGCYSYDTLTCMYDCSVQYAFVTHKFTGNERDSESGLDMSGVRYYGSNLGRFMTPDWAAKPTNVPYAMFGDPQPQQPQTEPQQQVQPQPLPPPPPFPPPLLPPPDAAPSS